MTAIRYGVYLALLLLVAGTIGCGGGGMVTFEKVTKLSITPEHPAVDQDVQVAIEFDSNVNYPAAPGYGPKFTYSVTAGELSGTIYSFETGDNIEVHGTTIVSDQSSVTWHTPATPGEASLTATATDGGRHLEVTVLPAGG